MSDAAAIESISAVTLVVTDMARAHRFYADMGFATAYGGPEASFTSLSVGEGFVNLALGGQTDPPGFWGRLIFHVSDVDAFHRRALDAGYAPEAAPRDAPWGERYFHLRDPDGHELSFARPLDRPSPEA